MVWPLVISFALSFVLIPLVRRISIRFGKVVQPRGDRWHSSPTPTLGGISIFVAFVFPVLLLVPVDQWPIGVLVGGGIAFILGLVDDFRSISPQSKLIGLFLAATVMIISGYITQFTPFQIVNIAISFIWMVGISNALNLIDNMDGLASGTALIVSIFLAYFFWTSGNTVFLSLALAIAGAILGFFFHNFPPASIFMGDSGSLFLGMSLATLAIAREPQASNVFAIIGVPTLVFLLPILDTVMVFITRLLRGQSPAQGGRDHTSHRLVYLGLSEKQTLILLLSVAVVSGIAAIVLEGVSYFLSLVLIPVFVLIFSLFTAYLGQLKLIDYGTPQNKSKNVLTNWVVDLTFRRRVFEVLLDFFLIGFAYIVAFSFVFGLSVAADGSSYFVETLSITIVSTFISFFLFGIYRGIWRYLGFEDMLRFGFAVLMGTVLSGLTIQLLFSTGAVNYQVHLLYGFILAILIFPSRLSFRVLDNIVAPLRRTELKNILIYGAGDAGEFALRECKRNTKLAYQPVGFVDDDPLKRGRTIHGMRVLGGVENLEELLLHYKIDGVIVAGEGIEASDIASRVAEVCKRNNVWLRFLRFEFELA